MNHTPPTFRIVNADRSLHEYTAAKDEVGPGFAEFMMHGKYLSQYWDYKLDKWSAYQFALIDNKSGRAAAFANSFPLYHDIESQDLPDGGLDWAIATAAEQSDNGTKPTIACALQIVIARQFLGTGLSYKAVKAMCDNARRMGAGALIAPVRPNRRESRTEIPFDEYVLQKRDDGLPVDDWLRVHVKLGGKMRNVCRSSYTIEGTLEEWKEWTGVALEEDGPHFVPRSLVPVDVDTAADRAVYVEPNVWFVHELSD